MDVLVEWTDGTKNVVSTAELEAVPPAETLCLIRGSRVRMKYKKKYYSGTVVATEDDDESLNSSSYRAELSDSDDDVPLSNLAGFSTEKSSKVQDESVRPPSSEPKPCVVCDRGVFAACGNCSAVLCFDHFFEENVDCAEVHLSLAMIRSNPILIASDPDAGPDNRPITPEPIEVPEDFFVEGAEKEGTSTKRKSTPIKKKAKRKRNSGEEYVSPNTGKKVSAKKLGPRCNGACDKFGKSCNSLSDANREDVHQAYYKSGDIQSQRCFIIKHVTLYDKKANTTSCIETPSRRLKSLEYRLPLNGGSVLVCKKMFLNTLSVSEKFVRVTLSKVNENGILEKDNRGGRAKSLAETDSIKRKSVLSHINRFPRVESHYCRSSTRREYLHSDLSIQKMYELYLKDKPVNEPIAKFDLYKRVFTSMNLSFHRPKKDQCSLCMTFKTGDEKVKESLKEKYNNHEAEKIQIRKIKQECKEESQKKNSKHASACFDLQQVIYLPISKEGALFYKRRFSVYNFTIYDLATRNCFCYLWNESDSKRGSSEIATCVYKFLQAQDVKQKQCVNLFADGCSGQNKNSIIAAMLIYFVRKSNYVNEVNLRFFESYHGQNEGDSAHSAIGYAIKASGDLFVPSQLPPILRLARRKNPYSVETLTFKDFLGFKLLSKELRILNARDNDINWTAIVELRVIKQEPQKIFFKNSHVDTTYLSISLQPNSARQKAKVSFPQLKELNKNSRPIPKEKYDDLLSLCTGDTPLIRNPEHVSFYTSLQSSKNAKKG